MQDILKDLLTALAPIAFAWLAVQLQAMVGVGKDTAAAAAINLAVERAAGLVYQQATKQGIPLTDDVRLSPLYLKAVGEIQQRLPQALARKDVTALDLMAMARGEMGKAMVADPNTAGPPPAGEVRG